MPEFSDFLDSYKQKQQIMTAIENHTITLCGKLYDDAKFSQLRYHGNAIDHIESDSFKGDKEVERAYHIRKIHEIDNNGVNMEFYIKPGRKYLKIMMKDGTHGSVHAFVDKKTGDVYKAASIKAPAKGVRYNLLDDDSREKCFSECDWAGSYLYIK